MQLSFENIVRSSAPCQNPRAEVIDKLERKVFAYLRMRATTGEIVDKRELSDLFGIAKVQLITEEYE